MEKVGYRQSSDVHDRSGGAEMGGWSRKLAFAFFITLVGGVGAVAQLPRPIPPTSDPSTPKDPSRDQLKAEIAALLGDGKDPIPADSATNERAKLQAKLQELLY